jgi:hypothetical protein
MSERLTTDNTKVIRIWDTEYEFWIELDLTTAIAAARAECRGWAENGLSAPNFCTA